MKCLHVFERCESRSGGESSAGPRLYVLASWSASETTTHMRLHLHRLDCAIILMNMVSCCRNLRLARGRL